MAVQIPALNAAQSRKRFLQFNGIASISVWPKRNFSTPNPPIRNKSCVQLSAPVARRNMTGDYDDPDLGGFGGWAEIGAEPYPY